MVKYMGVWFEDAEGNNGTVGEDLSLEEYSGPHMFKTRLEDTLSKMDSGSMKALYHLETLDEKERLARIAEVLADLTLVREVQEES